MIKVVDVNKTFGDKKVLKDINIDFKPGKVNIIIGKSGSGKTVLLKSLVGLHQVDSGQILLEGVDFTKLKEKEKGVVRKDMGMLFQGSALFDSATIEENVLYPLEFFTNFSYKEKIERVNFCLNRVNLSDAKHLYPNEISGGMQKRAAIARAIALNPKYLFCDEPNSGLDPQTSIIIDELIKEITHEYNITTVVNTHDMNSVFAISDNITFIHEGFSWWKGQKENILEAKNKELDEFLYASKLMQKLKKQYTNNIE